MEPTKEPPSPACRVKIDSMGRILLPVEIRSSLNIQKGDELLLSVAEDGLRLCTMMQAVREAQTYFQQFKKPGESVVDEFLRGRREEAERE